MRSLRACENVLKVVGPANDVSRLRAKGKSVYYYDEENTTFTELSFDRFLPVPKELMENCDNHDPKVKANLKEKLGFDDMFDWREEKWGTDLDIVADNYGDRFVFSTEWDAPVKAIVGISKQFPGLTFYFEYRNFRYADDTLADFGDLVIQDGKIISEKTKENARCVCCSSCGSFTGQEDCADQLEPVEKK